jgi:hypothetical protein
MSNGRNGGQRQSGPLSRPGAAQRIALQANLEIKKFHITFGRKSAGVERGQKKETPIGSNR